jgi:ABC-2 type transport system permease protein
MKSCLIFFGKEIREHIRSYRLLILGVVFILFGIMSPATAKFTPELIKALGGGIVLNLPPVSVLDSYVQFFKNLSGIGIIILLLVFAGSVADEKAKGSASLILTKSISRASFLFSKYAGAALVWTAVYGAGALVCQGYTLWFFPGCAVPGLLISFVAFWLYGLLLLALTLLASAIAGSHGLGSLGAFAGWGLLMLSLLPRQIASYSPAALGAMNVQLLNGGIQPNGLIVPAVLALALIGLSLGAAAWSLSRQEL